MTTARPPVRMRKVLALEDLDARARRFLPRPIYGYVAGGVEQNLSLRANRQQFERWSLMPRALVDVSIRSQSVQLFGETFAHPFGIAPMGISALIAYEGDLSLARAAEAARIPMMVSATGLIRLEEIKQVAPRSAWYQAYLPGDESQIAALVTRVAAAGFTTFTITVDCNMLGNRENLVRVGFSTPLRPTPRLFWDGFIRPAWTLGTLGRTLAKRGMLHFENAGVNRGVAVISRDAQRSFLAREQLNWTHVALVRKLWKGRLILKGILSAEDTRMALQHDVDGIVVSNHGGRQLDGAVTPLQVLPEIIAVKGGMAVMVDSGIRRGTDVLKALALGADFVFVGRPFIYAAALGQQAGVNHAIRILAAEIDRDLGMLGITSLAQMGPNFLRANS